MIKSVSYKGTKIKVRFHMDNHTRIVDKIDANKRIIEAHGTKDFIINAKRYKIEWTMIYKERHNVRLHFEGFSCPDNDKKMIEHIINKYGVLRQ